jgi:folylpolyglutamate synthase/dihydrofolate synthase
VSVIAEIGLDHTKTLGDTIAAIAAEKAGIIKQGRPVVASTTHTDAVVVVEAVAQRNGSPLKRLGRDFTVSHQQDGFNGARVAVETWKCARRFDWRLLGAHQARNASLAWAALDVLADEFGVRSPPENALSRLQIPGRLEVILREPFVVLLDVAHNEPSAAALGEFLRSIDPPPNPRVLVFGATRDKNWPAMLDRLLPLFDAVVATEYRRNARATPVQQVAARLANADIRTVVAKEPVAAWNAAQELLGDRPGGLVTVAGSFFLAAEIRPTLLSRGPQNRIE